jgi:regulator of sigma E protease
MVTTIVAFLVILIVLILAHELGHFASAKASGVKVEEFGLFLPPRLFSVKRGETRYSVNAIPLGGFVRMAGEDDPGEPRSLASKPIPIRLVVLGAGSLMNLLLPLILLSISFMIPHSVVTGQVLVVEVAPNSPAAEAGIEAGDIFVSINGNPVQNIGDLTRYFYRNLGKQLTAEIKRTDSTIEEVQLTARRKPPEGEGAVGIAVRTVDPVIERQSYPFWKAVPLGAGSYGEIFVLLKNGVVSMMVGAEPVEVTGPVGIAQLTGEVAKLGISPLLEFASIISINLAIINIFPIPPFDGGKIVFVLLEWARRGKRVSPKTERMIHTIGFLLLIAAFVAITYNDIMRFISGESLLS